MNYFNYHSKIKKLIEEGQLIKYEFVDEYNSIKPALVLYFKNCAPVPIKEFMFDDYLKILHKKH